MLTRQLSSSMVAKQCEYHDSFLEAQQTLEDSLLALQWGKPRHTEVRGPPPSELKSCPADGFQPRQVHYGFSVTKEMTVERSWGERVYTQLYFHGGRSITKISPTQSKSACSKPVSASGPLCPHSHPLGLLAHTVSCTAILWASVLGTVTTAASALLQPCDHVTRTTEQSSLYRANSNILPMCAVS